MKADCHLLAHPTSVPAARRFVTGALAGYPAEAIFRAELMVSELATNCVIHAGTAFTVSLTTAGRVVRIEVSDDGVGEPAIASPPPTEPHGRGLRLVDQLATTWGIASSPRQPGTTMWFSLLADERPVVISPARARERTA